MTPESRWRQRLLQSVDRIRRSVRDRFARTPKATSPDALSEPPEGTPVPAREPEPGLETPLAEPVAGPPDPPVVPDRAEAAPADRPDRTYVAIGRVRRARSRLPGSRGTSDGESSRDTSPPDSHPDTSAPTLVFGAPGSPPRARRWEAPAAVRGLVEAPGPPDGVTHSRPTVRVRTRFVPAESSDTGIDQEPEHDLSDDLFDHVARIINGKLRTPADLPDLPEDD